MSIRNRILGMKSGGLPPAQPAPSSPAPVRRRRIPQPTEQFFPSDNVPDGDGFVVKCVRLADTAPEETRAGSDLVHVSSLVSGDWCPRAHLIYQRHMQGMSESVLSQMHIVWIMGRAAEHHVRTQFIRMHGRHRVIGKWRCKCGDSEHIGPGTLTTACTTCGGGLDRYGELDLLDHEANVGGHPDLVFVNKSDELEVVEIKSIKKDDFAKLLKPLPTHVLQCESYVRIIRQTMPGKVVKGRILYVAKDYISPRVSPYLEFPLPDKESPVLDALRSQAIDMQSHASKGTLPDRLPQCLNPHVTRAKNCGACALCFSL